MQRRPETRYVQGHDRTRDTETVEGRNSSPLRPASTAHSLDCTIPPMTLISLFGVTGRDVRAARHA